MESPQAQVFLLARIAYIIVRLNDILVSGKNDAEHLKNSEEVLKRLSNAGLRLKENKCVFMAAWSLEKASHQWKLMYKQ